MFDDRDLLAAIEAVIFVSAQPVTPKRLHEVFPEASMEDIEAALRALGELHGQEGRGLMLDRVAGGYRLATRPAVHAQVARFVQLERAERLSLRTLETLAVVAYRQPVTAAEIQEIRGVDPSGTLRTLVDRSLVKIVGRKKVVGRPFVYGTTAQFLKTFGLHDLSELPTLKELEEIASDLPQTRPEDVDQGDELEDGEPLPFAGTEPAEGIAEEDDPDEDPSADEDDEAGGEEGDPRGDGEPPARSP